jgi:hypothetical protein
MDIESFKKHLHEVEKLVKLFPKKFRVNEAQMKEEALAARKAASSTSQDKGRKNESKEEKLARQQKEKEKDELKEKLRAKIHEMRAKNNYDPSRRTKSKDKKERSEARKKATREGKWEGERRNRDKTPRNGRSGSAVSKGGGARKEIRKNVNKISKAGNAKWDRN